MHHRPLNKRLYCVGHALEVLDILALQNMICVLPRRTTNGKIVFTVLDLSHWTSITPGPQ